MYFYSVPHWSCHYTVVEIRALLRHLPRFGFDLGTSRLLWYLEHTIVKNLVRCRLRHQSSYGSADVFNNNILRYKLRQKLVKISLKSAILKLNKTQKRS